MGANAGQGSVCSRRLGDRHPLRRRSGWVVIVLAVVAVAVIGESARSSLLRQTVRSRSNDTVSSGTDREGALGPSGRLRRDGGPNRRPALLRMAPLPVGAADVAAAYATAVCSWLTGETAAGWLARIAPLTSPTWWHLLERSDPAPPTAAVSVSVLQILPAHALGGRVAADVVVERAPGGPGAVFVELQRRGGAWVVVGSS